jgi:Domain of unknown function DUF29
MASVKPSPSELYEQDYYAWIQEQVRALRERRTEAVDWENVAEEIEDLGKSEKRSIESHLETLIEHLLKLAYMRGLTRTRNARLWEGSASLARVRIRRLLDESPSLRSKLEQIFAAAYETGRIKALSAMKLPKESIPAATPWTLHQVMDDNFMPKPDN